MTVIKANLKRIYEDATARVRGEGPRGDIVAAMDLDDAFRVMDQLRATIDGNNPEDEQDERLQVAAPDQF